MIDINPSPDDFSKNINEFVAMADDVDEWCCYYCGKTYKNVYVLDSLAEHSCYQDEIIFGFSWEFFFNRLKERIFEHELKKALQSFLSALDIFRLNQP